MTPTNNLDPQKNSLEIPKDPYIRTVVVCFYQTENKNDEFTENK